MVECLKDPGLHSWPRSHFEIQDAVLLCMLCNEAAVLYIVHVQSRLTKLDKVSSAKVFPKEQLQRTIIILKLRKVTDAIILREKNHHHLSSNTKKKKRKFKPNFL